VQNPATCAKCVGPQKRGKERGAGVQKETGRAEVSNRCSGNEKHFSCRGKFIYIFTICICEIKVGLHGKVEKRWPEALGTKGILDTINWLS